MFAPDAGDILLRGSSETGFTVLDAISTETFQSGVTFEEGVAFARTRGAITVWFQQLDDRGRPLAPPQPVVAPH